MLSVARGFLLASGVLVGTVLVGCSTGTSDKNIREVTVPRLRRLVENAGGVAELKRQAEAGVSEQDVLLLIDPRVREEFERAHLPGASNMSLLSINPGRSLDPSIARYETIVVYGMDPAAPSARAMTKRLMIAGYSEVYLLAGGMRAWLDDGGEVVTPDGRVVNPDELKPATVK